MDSCTRFPGFCTCTWGLFSFCSLVLASFSPLILASCLVLYVFFPSLPLSCCCAKLLECVPRGLQFYRKPVTLIDFTFSHFLSRCQSLSHPLSHLLPITDMSVCLPQATVAEYTEGITYLGQSGKHVREEFKYVQNQAYFFPQFCPFWYKKGCEYAQCCLSSGFSVRAWTKSIKTVKSIIHTFYCGQLMWH